MRLYTILNLLILAFPLLLSFDRKVAFWRRWPRVAATIVLAGGAFAAWDVIVTGAGHWSFDPELAGSGRILGLPAGEFLFFAVVPYACLFILEVARSRFPDRSLGLPRALPASLALAAAAAAPSAAGRGYTFIVLTSLALAAALAAGPGLATWRRRSSWIGLGLAYVPFLVFNGVFTGLPIVRYDPGAIVGLRLGSIPVEDFAYNLSLLALCFMVYDLLAPRGRSEGGETRRTGAAPDAAGGVR